MLRRGLALLVFESYRTFFHRKTTLWVWYYLTPSPLQRRFRLLDGAVLYHLSQISWTTRACFLQRGRWCERAVDRVRSSRRARPHAFVPSRDPLALAKPLVADHRAEQRVPVLDHHVQHAVADGNLCRHVSHGHAALLSAQPSNKTGHIHTIRLEIFGQNISQSGAILIKCLQTLLKYGRRHRTAWHRQLTVTDDEIGALCRHEAIKPEHLAVSDLQILLRSLFVCQHAVHALQQHKDRQRQTTQQLV